MCAAVLPSYMSAGNPNSGPYAFTTSTLPTESSHQPQIPVFQWEQAVHKRNHHGRNLLSDAK